MSYTALLFLSLAHNSDNMELKSPDRIEDISCFAKGFKLTATGLESITNI